MDAARTASGGGPISVEIVARRVGQHTVEHAQQIADTALAL